MSAFISFAESKKVRLPEWTGQMRSGLLGLVVGVLLFYIAVTVFIPSDTYSTARWYDSLGINQAFTGTVSWFAAMNPVLINKEGAFFSVFVSVANLALSYQAAFGGYWFEDDPDSNLFTVIKAILTGKTRKLNMVKVGYFVILLGITVFETATGMEFRQRDETWAGAFKAAAVAFIVENAGSDWALTAGIGMALGGVLQVYDAYILGRDDIGRIRGVLKKNQPQAQPQKQGQPNQPQSPQQPVRQPQSNGNNGGGKPHQTPPGGHGRGDRQGDGQQYGQPSQRPPTPRIHPATPDELDKLFDGMFSGGH